MRTLLRALLPLAVASNAAAIAGYTLSAWDPELSLGTAFLLVVVALLPLCASIWLACATLLRMGRASRIGPALVLPLIGLWAWLQWDGRMFNNVIFVIFLFPLLLLEGGLLVLLERRRPHRAM